MLTQAPSPAVQAKVRNHRRSATPVPAAVKANANWVKRLKIFFRSWRLEREIRRSRKFQSLCEQWQCPGLAEFERQYRQDLERTLAELRQVRALQACGESAATDVTRTDAPAAR